MYNIFVFTWHLLFIYLNILGFVHYLSATKSLNNIWNSLQQHYKLTHCDCISFIFIFTQKMLNSLIYSAPIFNEF